MIMDIFASKKPRNTSLESGASVNPEYAAHENHDDFTLFSEELFRRVLTLERKRSERSRNPFVLMLIHTGKLLQGAQAKTVLEGITRTLATSKRETDLHGWYRSGRVIGVICTEIGSTEVTLALSALHSRVISTMRYNLELAQMNEIHISFHVFPDELDHQNGGGSADIHLYPDLLSQDNASKVSRLVKRAIDIAGSLAALTVLSPLLAVIAVAIKLTSKGPILFRQTRVGQYGVRFTFLKFRSMYFRNDPKIHQDFIKQLIAGKAEGKQEASADVYKIKNDPRITPIGRFLRKTSLDELPQFLNVLIGQMSLVGPRPPIPYEVEAYDIWHRRRFLEIKPGITGLWQVEGRSRIKFDEMVRLDLRYAKIWSPWLDIKILLRTPAAVLRGDGAY